MSADLTKAAMKTVDSFLAYGEPAISSVRKTSDAARASVSILRAAMEVSYSQGLNMNSTQCRLQPGIDTDASLA